MLRAPRPASLLANARRAWRRSLQLRVVTITLAASGALVLTFGLVVGSARSPTAWSTRRPRSELPGRRQRLRLRPRLSSTSSARTTRSSTSPGRGQSSSCPAVAGRDEDVDRGARCRTTANARLAGAARASDCRRSSASAVARPRVRRSSACTSIWDRTTARPQALPRLRSPARPDDLGQVQLYYLYPLDDVVASRPTWSATPSRSPASPWCSCSAWSCYFVTRMVVTPGPGRRPDRAAPVQRPARPAHGGHRRGRPGRAGRLVQPDGREPAAADPAAGGDVAAAAPVHLRRLARAAYAADHRTDGGRPDLQQPRRASTRWWPAAPNCCRPSWTGSRACSPSCWRSAGSTPGSPRSTPSRPTSVRWSSGSVERLRRVAERAGVDDRAGRAGRRRWSPRSTSRRVERILRNLDRQRDRAQRGPAGAGPAGRPTRARSR